MKRTRVLAIVLVALIAAVAIYFFVRSSASAEPATLSGTVEATDADLGFAVPGRIAQVIPQEGDRVRAGDTLALLDRTELAAHRAQTAAALSAARATLTELESGSRPQDLAQAHQADSIAAARLSDASLDFDRTQKLYAAGAVPRDALDKAQLALNVARGTREQASEQLSLVQTGPRVERIEAQQSVVQQAQAALRQADANMANGVIVAPFNGVVAVRDREPGETVAAGTPVLSLLRFDDRWVRVYVREDLIGAVKLGELASITTDTYSNRTYPGAVSFIASQAEFTPRNVQTAEERVTLVYAVKVRITGDSAGDLKPGMPADVRLSSGTK